jgi:hypothetical protein
MFPPGGANNSYGDKGGDARNRRVTFGTPIVASAQRDRIAALSLKIRATVLL